VKGVGHGLAYVEVILTAFTKHLDLLGVGEMKVPDFEIEVGAGGFRARRRSPAAAPGAGNTAGERVLRKKPLCQVFKVLQEVSLPVEAPLDDEGQCHLRRREIGGGGLLEQCADVDRILGAAFIVAGEDLERQELGDPGDGELDAREDLDHRRLLDDLGLDARRCEEKIENDPVLAAAGRDQPDGGEATGGLLFENGVDPVTACLHREDQGFCFAVTLQSDGEIDIAGEPWLRPSGNRQTANQGPWVPQIRQRLLGVDGNAL